MGFGLLSTIVLSFLILLHFVGLFLGLFSDWTSKYRVFLVWLRDYGIYPSKREDSKIMEGSYRIYISYQRSSNPPHRLKRLEWLCYDPDGMEWIDVPRQPEAYVDLDKPLAVGTELLVFGTNHALLEKTDKFSEWTNSWSLGRKMRPSVAEIESGLFAIHKFSAWTNSWSLGREMNEPRYWFGSASLGEIAIVAGGKGAEYNILSSAEIYNSATGTWESLPRMNRPRALCFGVFMDGNFYVVGGMGTGEEDKVLTCGEMYDLGTRRWSEIPNMFPSIFQIGTPLLAVAKNELYAAIYWKNEVWKYDKGRNLWSTVGNLPEGVSRCYWLLTTLTAYGDQLILIVGEQHIGGVKVYECVPDEGPLQWNLMAFNGEPGLPSSATYNCTAMGIIAQ